MSLRNEGYGSIIVTRYIGVYLLFTTVCCVSLIESVGVFSNNNISQVGGKATCCSVAFGRSLDRDEEMRA
jgi:hypothetical protein